MLADAGEEDELAALQAEAAEDEVVDRPDAAGQSADLAQRLVFQAVDGGRLLREIVGISTISSLSGDS